MARYACALIIVAGLTACVPQVRYIPTPVPIAPECPTLEDQISPALYAPVRELGRREVSARGGLNRDLWLVFAEMEEELKYCNARFDTLRDLVQEEKE